MKWSDLKDIKIDLFELGAALPLGLLGEQDPPEALLAAGVEKTVLHHGGKFERHNLHDDPVVFIETPVIAELLRQVGDDGFPAILVNGELKYSGRPAQQSDWASALDLDDFDEGWVPVTEQELEQIRAEMEQIFSAGCGGSCGGCSGGCGCC